MVGGGMGGWGGGGGYGGVVGGGGGGLGQGRNDTSRATYTSCKASVRDRKEHKKKHVGGDSMSTTTSILLFVFCPVLDKPRVHVRQFRIAAQAS
jgi:hypothetical protein